MLYELGQKLSTNGKQYYSTEGSGLYWSSCLIPQSDGTEPELNQLWSEL